MTEFFKHMFGICGEHWHPNIWTAFASIPIIAPTIYYFKCKCGKILKRKRKKKKEKQGVA